ncbi:hypothetical protein GCM10029964_030580 [Kibdelosporangium lantanae]
MTTTTVGGTVTIELAATPTTGYQWRPVDPPAALALVDTGFTPAGAAPGEGGVQWFRFAAQEAGLFTLSFVLKRAWEDDPVNSETIVVDVHSG